MPGPHASQAGACDLKLSRCHYTSCPWYVAMADGKQRRQGAAATELSINEPAKSGPRSRLAITLDLNNRRCLFMCANWPTIGVSMVLGGTDHCLHNVTIPQTADTPSSNVCEPQIVIEHVCAFRKRQFSPSSPNVDNYSIRQSPQRKTLERWCCIVSSSPNSGHQPVEQTPTAVASPWPCGHRNHVGRPLGYPPVSCSSFRGAESKGAETWTPQ
jgi:hypothetical protein